MSGDNVTLLPAWKNAAAELFSGKYGYGDVVSHEELQSALGLPEPQGMITAEKYKGWQIALLAQIDALKAHLLEDRNMCLRSVQGQGYEVVDPSRQTEYAFEHGMRLIRKESRRMMRRLTFIDRSALTIEQARENADAMVRASWVSQQVRRAPRMRIEAEQKKIG